MGVKDLLNPKSTGFKKLGLELDRLNEKDAVELINGNPKIMRRPLLTDGESLAAGFSEESFSMLVG